MELLHKSGLTDLQNWVECLERVQKNLDKHSPDRPKARPHLENAIQNQQGLREVSPENRMPFVRQSHSRTKGSLDSTVQDLTLHGERMDRSRHAIELVNLFKDKPLLPGIIITESDKFSGMISRRRFFEYMSRPYSWELFSKRPIMGIYQIAKTEILTIKNDTSIVSAAKQSLERSPELIYEPLLVVDDRENYQLLDVHQLLLAQSQLHDEATKALREAEAQYRSIFENAVDGIFQSTPDGRYIKVNPALAKLYGYDSPAELMGSISNIEKQIYVDPYRRTEFIACIEKYDRVSKFESQVYRKDGSIIWISENARAIRDANGTLVYYEGTTEDVTDRKEAEEALRQSEARYKQKAAQLEEAFQVLGKTQAQLVQSEKMSSLGQLVAGVAHEINNPVGCIYGNLPHADRYIHDLLHLLQLYIKHYPQPPEEIEREIEEIDLQFLSEDLPQVMSAMHQGAERIREIVLSLRNFSRLDEKQMQPIQIHDAIDSTLLILQHRLKPKGGLSEIQVIKEYGNLPLVKCYPGQLNQVFMNLLGNAIDALEMQNGASEIADRESDLLPKPMIRIRTEVVDNFVRIGIADNGPGMTGEVCQRLFEPFFTTKPTGKGTGLGLSISYQIVAEKHNGRLSCISTAGQGAEFAIEIPL